MRDKDTGIRELRLIIHCWPRHTTVALLTRTVTGSENWDRREHSWDLPLPKEDYQSYRAEDQLWMILGALAATHKPPRSVTWAEPPGSPSGDTGGCRDQSVLPGFTA